MDRLYHQFHRDGTETAWVSLRVSMARLEVYNGYCSYPNLHQGYHNPLHM